ncbi:MAG TPA: hypothetical protein VLV54_12060, partial [Thermoanaerobaculia bacterium]|nr:hypothetical protein [Thermoanaerobaculia bacterium]
QEVDLVALIDTLPPAAEASLPAPEEELVARFAEDLARLLGHNLAMVERFSDELRGLPAAEKLDQLTRLAQEAGLLPRDFGPAEIRPLFATFAANFQASRAYARRPYSGNVALFLSSQTFDAYGPEILDGWRRAALGGVEASTLPGDHYSLLRRPQVERLAGELTARIAAAAERPLN